MNHHTRWKVAVILPAVVALVSLVMALPALFITSGFLPATTAEIIERVQSVNGHVVVLAYSSQADWTDPIRSVRETPGVRDAEVFAIEAHLLSSGEQARGVLLKTLDHANPGSVERTGAWLEAGRLPQPGASPPEIILGHEAAHLLPAQVGDQLFLARAPLPTLRFDGLGSAAPPAPTHARRVKLVGTLRHGMTQYDQQLAYVASDDWRSWGQAMTGIAAWCEDADQAAKVAERLRTRLGPSRHVLDWRELNQALVTATDLQQRVVDVTSALAIAAAVFLVLVSALLAAVVAFAERPEVRPARDAAVAAGCGLGIGVLPLAAAVATVRWLTPLQTSEVYFGVVLDPIPLGTSLLTGAVSLVAASLVGFCLAWGLLATPVRYRPYWVVVIFPLLVVSAILLGGSTAARAFMAELGERFTAPALAGLEQHGSEVVASGAPIETLRNATSNLTPVEARLERRTGKVLAASRSSSATIQVEGVHRDEARGARPTLANQIPDPDPEGAVAVLLGDELAKTLHVVPGDTATFLGIAADGRLRRTEVAVAGTFHTGYFPLDSEWATVFDDDVARVLGPEAAVDIALRVDGPTAPVVRHLRKELGTKASIVDETAALRDATRYERDVPLGGIERLGWAMLASLALAFVVLAARLGNEHLGTRAWRSGVGFGMAVLVAVASFSWAPLLGSFLPGGAAFADQLASGETVEAGWELGAVWGTGLIALGWLVTAALPAAVVLVFAARVPRAAAQLHLE